MHFADGINRPPYETADGYLQTTQGCSHNHCLFCTYFKDRAFRRSPIEEIEADIKEMPRRFSPTYGNSPTEATRRICAATAK